MTRTPPILRRRLSWTSVVIPALLAILVFGGAIYVRQIELQAVRQQTRQQAENVSAVFSARLADHVTAILNAAQLFRPVRTSDGRLDYETFREDADRMRQLFDDLQALNYVDAKGIIRIVTPLEGNEAALGVDIRSLDVPSRTLAEAEAAGALRITPPITLTQGGTGFVGYLPLGEAGGPLGFLNIVFRADALITPLLTDHMAGTFDIRIMDAGAPVFATAGREEWPESAAIDEIDIAGRTWQIEVAPIAAYGRGAFFGSVILPFGIAGALIVGALSFLVASRQASLEDSRERLFDFAAASSDWYWETDAEHRLAWLSEGFERAFGVRPDAFLGKDRSTLVAHDEAGGMPHDRNLDLSGHQPFRDFSYPVVIEGRQKWVRTSGVPVFDRDGAFLGYRGSASDITDEIEARQEADRAQWLLVTAVANLDELFAVWDAEDRLAIANARFRQVFGDILARLPEAPTFEEVMRAFVDAGRMPAALGREEEWVNERLAHHRNPTGTLEQTTEDGRIYRIKEQRLDNGATVLNGLEVTTQKRNEEALRASEERYELAARQVAIWDWDLKADKLYISPQFAGRLGYSRDEFNRIAARTVAEIIHPEDVGSYRAALARHLANPGEPFSHEHRFRTRAGGYRWFLARGQAVTDESGKAIRSTGILTDITDRVELEERLQQAQKMEAIGQLTGGLAHDFNNLLAVVQGHAEALSGLDGPEGRRAAAILRAARRGSDLTQRLLAFSRRQPLRPVAFDCAEATGGLLDLVQRTLGETIRVEMDMPPGLWWPMADPAQVESALLNLVINARDAMPDGGTVRIGARNVTAAGDEAKDLAAGDYVVLNVADEGHGMPDEVKRHAFEPFFTTKDVGKGTGLGLSMVYGFAQQSGGIATIDSAPGAGTTVSLYLPRAPMGWALPADRDEGAVPTGAGETVLVVEDDAELRALVAEMLTDLGYRVIPAGDVATARGLLAEAPAIDLVLSDVILPGGSHGADFSAELAASHPGLGLVLMSGYPAEAGSGGGTWDLGRPILVKPFGKAQLARTVHDAMKPGPKSLG